MTSLSRVLGVTIFNTTVLLCSIHIITVCVHSVFLPYFCYTHCIVKIIYVQNITAMYSINVLSEFCVITITRRPVLPEQS